MQAWLIQNFWGLSQDLADPEIGNPSLNPGRAWGDPEFGNSRFQPGGILADPRPWSSNIPGILHCRCHIHQCNIPGGNSAPADGWERSQHWDNDFCPSFLGNLWIMNSQARSGCSMDPELSRGLRIVPRAREGKRGKNEGENKEKEGNMKGKKRGEKGEKKEGERRGKGGGKRE